MNATLAIGTRDDMATLFDGMGLLVDEPDADGYRTLYRPLVIGGTLAEPDTSDLWQLLDNAHGFLGFGLRSINRKVRTQQARQESGSLQ